MNRLRTWWYSRTDLYHLRAWALIVLALGGALPSIFALTRGESVEGFALNLGTEMLGALVTFLVFDRLLARYTKREAEATAQEKRKAGLIAQLRSSVNDDAKRAAEELLRHDWLADEALQDTYLNFANLREAYLGNANLRRASVEYATLQEANLGHADLQDAKLIGTNLQGTVLRGANLRGSQLQRANLQGAKLDHAAFNEGTVLPDGTHWTPDTDMTRFTDPYHRDAWRADYHAYRVPDDDAADDD